jgi:hypothetical protein
MFLPLFLLPWLSRLPLSGCGMFTQVQCILFLTGLIKLVTRSFSELASNHILPSTISNTCTNKENAEVKISVRGINAYRGRGATDPLTLIFRIRLSWVVSFLHRSLYSKERRWVPIESKDLLPQLVLMFWRSLFSLPGYELRSVCCLVSIVARLLRLVIYPPLLKQINMPFYLRPKT